MGVAKRPHPKLAHRTNRRRLLFLLLFAGVGGLVYNAVQESPQKLFDRARKIAALNPAEAAELLERSVAGSNGDYPEAQLLWCQTLGRLGRWFEALGCFSQINNPKQCDQGELVQFARQALAVNEQLLAEYALDAAQRPGSEQIHVLTLLIPLKLESGQQEAALRLSQQFIQLAPQNAFPWQVVAEIQAEQGETLLAVKSLREALKRNPPNDMTPAIRLKLTRLLIDAGENHLAREQMDQILSQGKPSESESLMNAYLLRLEGMLTDALQIVERVLVENSSSTKALFLRGILHLDLADFHHAAEDLKLVVQREPFNKEAHYKLAQCYLRLNHPQAAEQHLQTSRKLTEVSLQILELEPKLAKQPSNAELRNRLASLYEQSGQRDRANQLRHPMSGTP